MMIRISLVVLASVFALGCGGASKGAASAEDTMEDASEAMDEAGDDLDGAGDASDTDEASTDGIKRDADGDGQEDAAMPCSEMPETRCKISANCAWSTENECVEAGGM